MRLEPWCKSGKAVLNLWIQTSELAFKMLSLYHDVLGMGKKKMDRSPSLQILAAQRKTDLPHAIPTTVIYGSYCSSTQGPWSGPVLFGIV